MSINAFNLTVTATSFTASSGGTLGASVAATINSGSALPIGAATHWRLAINIGVSVAVSVDAVVPRGAVTAVTLEDATSLTAPDGYNVAGSVTTWSWSWANFDAGGGWPTNTPIDGSVTAVVVPSVTLDTPTLVDGSGVLLNWAPADLSGLTVESYDVFRDGENVASDLDGDVLQFADQTDSFETTFTYFVRMHLSDGSTIDSNSEDVTTGCETEEFNCACETVSAYSTLAQLRIRMAIQCGYAAMSANLPVGQAVEFNEYLLTAQKQLYYKFRSQRTERLFKWQMVPGQRYYGIADSEDCCDLKLDPLAITWVGFEDLNRAWYRLIEGIDPVYYTRANINFGWPTRYEIRSCIEVFPAPQAAYTLWIKGDIGLAPFAADADRPTFDDEAILLFAIANWKSAKGRADADRCMGQATQRIQDLTARKHGTARYVPSTYIQNPATPPRFLPLGSQQS